MVFRRSIGLLSASIIASTSVVSVAWASPPEDASASDAPARSGDELLEEASEAWGAGDWAVVQSLLGEAVNDETAFDSPLDLRNARLLLADALLQDTTLPPDMAQREAVDLISQVIDDEPDWSPPEAVYGRALYQAVETARALRDQAQAERCTVERASCAADLANEQSENTQLKLDYDELKLRYDAQEVEVVEKGIRSRALALIPFGFGHFINDKPALGIAFASSELAFGAVGLGLLLTRNVKYQCSRPNGGIGRDSLHCKPPNGQDTFTQANRDELERIRISEEVFAWLFLGTVVTDIVLAQILFEPESTLRSRRVPRSDLDRSPEDAGDGSGKRRDRRSARLRWRPTGGAGPKGASFGFRLDF